MIYFGRTEGNGDFLLTASRKEGQYKYETFQLEQTGEKTHITEHCYSWNGERDTYAEESIRQ